MYRCSECGQVSMFGDLMVERTYDKGVTDTEYLCPHCGSVYLSLIDKDS